MRLTPIITGVVSCASLASCAVPSSNIAVQEQALSSLIASASNDSADCLIREQNLTLSRMPENKRCVEARQASPGSYTSDGYVVKRLSNALRVGRIIRSDEDEMADQRHLSRDPIAMHKVSVTDRRPTFINVSLNASAEAEMTSDVSHHKQEVEEPSDTVSNSLANSSMASEKTVEHSLGMSDKIATDSLTLVSEEYSGFRKHKVPFKAGSLHLEQQIEGDLKNIVHEIAGSSKVLLRGYVNEESAYDDLNMASIQRAVSVKNYLIKQTQLPASHFKILYRKPNSNGRFVHMDVHHES